MVVAPDPRAPRRAGRRRRSCSPWAMLALFCLSLAHCAAPPAPPTPPAAPPTQATPPAGTPRLLLFLVIDQGAYDHLVRFRPLLRHGLARLLDESVGFAEMHHEHAPTATAPGHATLATGRFPAHHGVVDNDWFDRTKGRWVEAVDDPTDGLSPRALRASGLGDWIQETYAGAKVFTVSGKDRAAIFTGGLHPDGVFWFDREDGRFETSSYYAEALPAWLEAFHREGWLETFFATPWEPLPAVREALEEGLYGIEELPRQPVPGGFPYPRGTASLGPDENFYASVYGSPLADAYVGRMAAALLAGEELGRDPIPDFLGVSFSSLDVIGHRHGPDSPEFLDTLLRLDETLGTLLDAVDAQVGLDHTLVSLSADHGVLPNPETLGRHGHPEAGRFGAAEILCIQRAAATVEAELGGGRWTTQGLYLDREALGKAGLDLATVEERLARALERCPRVERVWTGAELAREPGQDEAPLGRLYRQGFDPERSPDLTLQERAFTLVQPTVVASHGSPYGYDTHVPWLVRLPAGGPGWVEGPARTIDVAPTLATALGVTAPSDLDGEDLWQIVVEAAASRAAPAP